MRAAVIEEFGDSSVLKIVEDAPKPQAGAKEVLIQVTFAGVNPVDWKLRAGYLKDLLPHNFPIILGWEVSGTVAAVGSEATKFAVGDEVYAYVRKPEVQHGAFAEFVTFPEEHVAKKPQSISHAQAAGVPLAALTAQQSLFDFAGLVSGQVALIHAGAGGVGGWGIQLAKIKGATVISTASAANHEYVKSLGADVVIDYRSQNFVDEVLKLHPDGVDVVFDTVGGDTQTESWKVVKENGVLVSIVSAPDAEQGKAKNIKSTFVFVAPNGSQLDQFREFFDAGKLQPLQTTERPLAEIAAVQDENQQRHVRGKVVLSI